MRALILGRLAWTGVLVVGVSALTFLIFNVLPTADPAKLRAGRNASAKAVEEIRLQFGYDEPLLTRFLGSLRDLVLHFDFGTSVRGDAPVRPMLLDALPNTLMLVLGAAIVWVVLGVAAGTVAAVWQGRLVDRAIRAAAVVAISAPVYWLGLVALYLFSSDLGVLGLFPAAGSYDAADGLLRNLDALILPWLVLAASFAAVYARLIRAGLIEVLAEDHIRTARAKGLRESRVVVVHGLRSAITPVVTLLGLDLGLLVGGAILTEQVFGIPGLGVLSFGAIERGDVDVVQGVTLFVALGVALGSLAADLLYALLDPRVRTA